MTDSTDSLAPVEDEDVAPTRRRRSRDRSHSWRTGGSTVRRWDWELVGWAALALGAGVLLSTLAARMIPGAAGPLLSIFAMWAALLAPIIVAFVRSRPRGLLRFRAVDILYGIALGLMLRVAYGFIEIAATGTATWPSAATLDGALPSGFWFEGVVAPILIAPVIEEFFFRGILLVALYSAIRRMSNSRTAAWIVSVLVTTVAFVLLHAAVAPVGWSDAAGIALLGAVCGLLVVFTGRIWPAVLTHIVFNATGVALIIVGTLAG